MERLVAVMLAIPVFRSRVAPVLNWCSRVFIISADGTDEETGREIVLNEINGFERLRKLRERGIDILICGALSPDLLSYGRSLGIQIIPGISGFIDEVLVAFREKKLSQPCFRLPGCMRGRGYRTGKRCCESGACGSPAVETKKNPSKSERMVQGNHAKGCSLKNRESGPMGVGVCPWCGVQLPE